MATLTYFKLEDLTLAQLVSLHNKFTSSPVKKFGNKAEGVTNTRAAIQACLDSGWSEDNVHDAVMNWASETKYKSAPAGLNLLWREGEQPPAGAAAASAPATPAAPAGNGGAGAGEPPAARQPEKQKRGNPNLTPREPRIPNGTLLKVGPNTRKGKIEAFQGILGERAVAIEALAKEIAEQYRPHRAEKITEGAARGYLSRGVDEGWFVKA